MENRAKDSNLIKLIIWTLIVLTIIVGVLGIYIKKLNKFSNLIPEFTYGSDIKGKREFVLKLDDSEEDKTVYVDEEGNIGGIARAIESENTDENSEEEYKDISGYTVENIKLRSNKEEDLNTSNYEKTKKIIEKRISDLNISDYKIRLDRQTGDMIIEMNQEDKTDDNLSMLIDEGKFEIVDNETGLILLDNKDIVSVAPVSNQSANGNTNLYLQIEFSKEGAKKLNEISKIYTQYVEDGKDEPSIDYISIEFDGSALRTMYFSEEWTTNYINIPIADSSMTTEELKEVLEVANRISTILNSGKLPLKYNVQSSDFVKSSITKNEMEILKYIVYGIFVLIFIVFTILYKKDGIKLGVSNIGFLALYTIILRILKVNITLSGLMAIGFVQILNISFYWILLSKKIEFNKLFTKFNLSIMPVDVLAVVFTLSKNMDVLSIGTCLFWGIVVFEIYNFVFVKNVYRKN